GEPVYGGSDLNFVRGTLADLLQLDLPERVRLAVTQAITYDAAVRAAFPDFFASRRNYDVIQGIDGDGVRRSGVLEQSWRAGGASAAEVAALQAFEHAPQLQRMRASTHEVHAADARAPAGADVYFDAVDPRIGRLLKYCVSEQHGRAP